MYSTNFALKHPNTIFVFAFLITIIGMVSYLTLPREAAPDIKIPTIIVMVPYPGVSPEDVESLVTNRLEAKFEDLTDLDEVTSTSSEGMSMVFVTFNPDTDLGEALTQVRDRVNRARSELPSDVLEPVVKEISSSDWPILKITISGNVGLTRLKRLGEELEKEIEAMPGVLEVDLAGGTQREIRVEVDPHKLLSYGISLDDLVLALRQENVNIPGGPVEEGDIRYTLRIPEEFKDPDEIRNIVISTKSGHPVRVFEVATIVDGFKDRFTVARYRGEECVSLSLKKQSGANIIKLVDKVKAYVDEASANFPPGTNHVFLNDFSKYIRLRVDELENNLLTALILVMSILFLFIGGRNALFVALAIPLSLLLTFILLDQMGVTLNMVVLFSLVLALGMLVDNAIVITENIFRHAKMGKPVAVAARDATDEVGWPVITSTLTTVAVFIPLLSWPGIMGEFMSYLPTVLIVSLIASLFVALVITPVIAAKFMPQPKGPIENADETQGLPDNWVMRGYRRLLEWCMDWRYVVIGAMVALLIGSIAAYFTSQPEVEFFPSTTPDRANLSVEAPEGTRIEATDRVALSLERYLSGLSNVKHYVSEVGYGSGFNSGEGTPYLARLALDFQDVADWTEHPLQTLEDLREEMALIPGASIRISKQKMGPPTGAPVNIEIAGEDYAVLSDVADTIQERIKQTAGLVDLSDDFSEGRPEIEIKFDRVLSNQLALLGLQAVAGAVRTAIYGTKATVYRVGEEEYDVTVRLADPYRKHREDVLALTVSGKEGRQIPLSQLVKLESTVGATAIQHVDRKRVITVSADVEGRSGPEVLKDVQSILKDYHPRGATISYTGENEEMDESKGFLGKALIIGVFLIFMILITQFDNIAQVSIILFTIILSMIGVFLGLFVNKAPFSILMTGMGVVSLAGVVVNNGIVLIDFINQLKAGGKSTKEACVLASMVRLRPVFLTAATTVAGLVPMATGIDVNVKALTIESGTSSTEFWGPMALAVTWGLSFATVLTLVVVPALYYSFDRAKLQLAKVWAKVPWLRTILLALGLLIAVLITYQLIVKLAMMAGA